MTKEKEVSGSVEETSDVVEEIKAPEGFEFKEISCKLGETGFEAKVLQAKTLEDVYRQYEKEEKDKETVEKIFLACWNRSQVSVAKRVSPKMKVALLSKDEGKIKTAVVERVESLLTWLQPVPTGRKGRATKSGMSAKQEKAMGAAIGAEMVKTGAFPTPERMAEIAKELEIDASLLGS